jgi:uncharacterized protein YjbJ (UPF0337 family)
MADDRTRRDDSMREEVSAFGERAKGAAKDAAGSITGNRRLEKEGELENLEGRTRQERNDVMDETDGVAGQTVTDRTDRAGSSVRGFSGATGAVTDDTSTSGRERTRDIDADAPGSVLGLNRVEAGGGLDVDSEATRDVRTDTVSGSTIATNVRPIQSDRDMVTGIYDTPEHAGHAYHDLTTRHGYKPADISVAMSDDTRKRHFGDATPGAEFKTGTKAAEGAGIGGATGMSVGAALGGLLAAATSIAIPGVGLIVAGPLAGAIAGAGAGGAAGTLLGALIGAGIPEERARIYDRGIREGGIVLGTRPRDEAHAVELERDFRTHGGRDVLR